MMAPRVLVPFTEGYSTVRSKRTADPEILKLCQSGNASESLRLSNSCFQARADAIKKMLFAGYTSFSVPERPVSTAGPPGGAPPSAPERA